METSVSVVIASRNEGPRLAATVAAICHELPQTGQVIVVDDASNDSSADNVHALDARVVVTHARHRLGVARARNLGARLAVGEVLIFSDAHVRPSSDWWAPLGKELRRDGVGAVGPALVDGPAGFRGYGLTFTDLATNLAWLDRQGDSAYPIPLVPGFFLAVRRDVFHQVGGFDSAMHGWGMEDNEFSVHLWTRGFECLIVPTVEVIHDRTVRVYHSDWANGLHNILRLGLVHFSGARLQGMLDHYSTDPLFPAALTAVLDGDLGRRRDHVHSTRCRDDGWYFQAWPLVGSYPAQGH